jgi:transcriptional regulator GlxA family with amidase domain
VLDRLLTRRIDAGSPVRPEVEWAWQRLLRAGGTVEVAALAAEVGWSARYLGKRFGVDIGLSPKAAARVMRFDRARRILQSRAGAGLDPGLAMLAVDCGYFDQAHLARDFGQFAGCSPSRWLAEEFRNVQAVGAGVPPDWVA